MKKSCLSNNSGSHTGLSENFDLEITDVTKKGLGLGRFNNRVVFCNNALPGDLVNVKVTGSKGSVITAEPIKFIKKSGQRADNVCLNKLACQACTLINLKYENQLFYKKKHFTDSLKRIGKIDSPENIPITLVPADQAHFNRNKAVFHFQKSDKIFQAGYYVPDSKKLVPIDNCILLTPSVNSALTSFINKLNDCTNNSLSDSGLDIIHKILVKYSNFTNQILFCLILKKNQACPKILKNILIDLVDNKIIHSAWVKETKKNKKTDFNIAGEKHLIESIRGKKFSINVNGFFQVNSFQTENLVAQAEMLIKKYSSENNILLDLYSGSGLFGISLSELFNKIIAVESEKASITAGLFNVNLNDLNNVSFIHSKSSDFLNSKDTLLKNELINSKGLTVLIDPPRTGCCSKTMDLIKSLNPDLIIYISCDPPTFARDLSNFSKQGYLLKESVLIDMFLHTMHMESCSVLKKSGSE